jgi:threonine/homoserine efflux transporter RhtA
MTELIVTIAVGVAMAIIFVGGGLLIGYFSAREARDAVRNRHG